MAQWRLGWGKMDALRCCWSVRAGSAVTQWSLDHLENGYLGFNYEYTEGETVLNYKDITRMWGLAKFLVVTRLHQSKL